MKKLAIFLTIAFIAITPMAQAQNWQPAGDQWIEKWWALDLVRNNGGNPASSTRDFLEEGTRPLSGGEGEITNAKASTRYGAGLTASLPVRLPATHGGVLGWSVVTLDINSDRNISRSHGFADESNVTWHGIILILSPDDRTTTMHPAHDDHAEIWLNGEQVYNNPTWTGGATSAPQPTEVNLIEGENFLHFKCGEGGGGDYVNLRFEETDDDLRIAPTLDGQFLNVLTPVEPRGKVTTTWADIKRR